MIPGTEYAVLVAEPPSLEERLVVSALREACPHDGPHVDPWAVLALVRLERVLGVDEWRPGLLAGVWCVEAGFRVETSTGERILGDYRDGRPMAEGPMQLWPVTRSWCGGTRAAPHDLVWSARCWVARVEAVLAKARRKCPRHPWRTAEAAVSNVRKYGWDCRRGSRHWRVAEAALGREKQ